MLIDLELYPRFEAAIRRFNAIAARNELSPLIIDLGKVVLMWPPRPIEIPKPKVNGAKYVIFTDVGEVYFF